MVRGETYNEQLFESDAFRHFINIFLAGESGVTKGCEITQNTTVINIAAGYFIIKGGLLKEEGTSISIPKTAGYYKLVYEIDLSKENSEYEFNQGNYKLLKGIGEYPSLTQEDLDNSGNIYQFEFCQFIVNEEGIQDFADKRTFLDFDSIYQEVRDTITEIEDGSMLSQVKNDLQNQINVEKSRIDEFTSLPEGSTAGDAELQDIRIGADGSTYSSAGAAVRGQFNNINKEAIKTSNIIITTSNYNENLSDANNAQSGLNYFLHYGITEEMVANLPEYGKFANLVTFHYSRSNNHGKFQLFVTEDSFYWRDEQGEGQIQNWNAWNKVLKSTDLNDLNNNMNNSVIKSSQMFILTTNYTNYLTDADNAQNGLNYFIHYGITEEMVANLPEYGKFANLVTFHYSRSNNHGKFQLFVTEDNMYWRVERGEGQAQGWNKWNKIITQNDIDTLEYNLNKTTSKIFKKVVCCGDSYTSGHIKLSGGETVATNENFAWPHYMSTLTGNKWENCGSSGATVLTWQTAERGLPKAKTVGKTQAYVIGLMINDTSDTYGVPLGTIDDIGTEAQTYYGGMSKIIRELNLISPKAKIFVNTCPKTGTKYTQYNQAVRDIVNQYKDTYPVFCIDLEAKKDLYSLSSLTSDAVNGHYTAIGYEQFAEIYNYILSDYINNHISDFQDVYEIEYDEETAATVESEE